MVLISNIIPLLPFQLGFDQISPATKAFYNRFNFLSMLGQRRFPKPAKVERQKAHKNFPSVIAFNYSNLLSGKSLRNLNYLRTQISIISNVSFLVAEKLFYLFFPTPKSFFIASKAAKAKAQNQTWEIEGALDLRRNVRQLFSPRLEAIKKADRSIYISSQFPPSFRQSSRAGCDRRRVWWLRFEIQFTINNFLWIRFHSPEL